MTSSLRNLVIFINLSNVCHLCPRNWRLHVVIRTLISLVPTTLPLLLVEYWLPSFSRLHVVLRADGAAAPNPVAVPMHSQANAVVTA